MPSVLTKRLRLFQHAAPRSSSQWIVLPSPNCPMVRNRCTKSYVVRHIKFLLWRSALCGAEDAGPARRRSEPPPMPHNSHQRSGSGEVPVSPDRLTLPNCLLSRYSDTISPARMVATEIMWVHYRRYCWSLTAPSSRIAAQRYE